MPASRQWQAALSLLWAASHQGHNTTDGGSVVSETLSPNLPAGQSTQDATNVSLFLRTVPHFYLLPPRQLAALADFGMRRDYGSGETVLEAHADVEHVRVVLAGVVDVVDARHGTVGTMEARSVFGLDSIIVQERSPFRFVCSYACSLLLLPVAEVMRVLQHSPSMRQSIGRKMSGQMGCFRTLKDFSRLLFSHDAMKYEYLPLQSIVEAYSLMPDSCVHRLKSSREIDTTAWIYALRRLPENVTRVFSLDLVRSLPPFLATRMRSLTRKAEKARQEDRPPDASASSQAPNRKASAGGAFSEAGSEFTREIRYVHTAQRRRCVWQLGIDGKNIMLMRDDFTDTLDFVLCLCIHIVESSKMRGKLQCLVHPSAIDILEDAMARSPRVMRSASFDNLAASSGPGVLLAASSTTSGPQISSASGSSGTATPAHGAGVAAPAFATGAAAAPAVSPTTRLLQSSERTRLDPQMETLKTLLESHLTLNDAESSGLIEMWGADTPSHLHDVLMHREEYLLRADSSVARRFQSDPFHDWALGVRGAVVRRMCLDRHSPLPHNLCIDVVFGLTRSILNCVSPCVRIYRDELLAYGRAEHPDALAQPWLCEEDMLYALIPDFLSRHPHMRATFNAHLEECGIEVLEDTALTGLQADIICTDMLDHPSTDQYLQRVANKGSSFGSGNGGGNGGGASSAGASGDGVDFSSGTHFLINIDYTFGAQAEGILKTLATVFGPRIRSVNVLGKVAGFKGTRAGDIIVADNVVASKMSLTSEDHMDEIRTINNTDVRIERVQEFLGTKRKARRGSVLTVASAMLCNEAIINYYKNVWNCVAFEIEGSYFARMVKECKSNGLLHGDVATRHVYLVRELPEDADGASTFARERFTSEILSAQNAIARTILDLTMRSADDGCGPGFPRSVTAPNIVLSAAL